MKITDVKFIKSVFSLNDLPKAGRPEIAFSGKSNVGKSSLINVLLNRKGIARTSSTPGRTQSLNFIDINSSLYFVDFPGYGYAKVPAAVKKNWGLLIEGYLKNRPVLCLVVIIVDSRRKPGDEEAEFAEWLKLQGIPFIVVLTKTDKLKKNSLKNSLVAWQKHLQINNIYVFSAHTGQGRNEIMQAIIKHSDNAQTNT